mgnify:CR=1 FL=1
MKKNENVIYISLVSLLMLITFIILLALSITKINEWKKDNKENNFINAEIQESTIIQKDNNVEGESTYKIDFSALKEINSDVVGWLEVPGTNVKYSVVKANNNDYYLTHNFNKEYNSSGWIFADYNNKVDGTDKNLIIYGHNVKDNSMFGSLKNIINEEWYNNQENYNITFMTENTNEIYRVFSVYKIEVEDYYIQTKFDNSKAFGNFVKTLKERSIKKFDEEVSAEDNILTLSTCANNNKYRIVLHAKKVHK